MTIKTYINEYHRTIGGVSFVGRFERETKDDARRDAEYIRKYGIRARVIRIPETTGDGFVGSRRVERFGVFTPDPQDGRAWWVAEAVERGLDPCHCYANPIGADGCVYCDPELYEAYKSQGGMVICDECGTEHDSEYRCPSCEPW